MGFMLSPGVNVTEIDLTTIIPAVSTSIGALVGQFAWGPIETRFLADSEVKLVNRFGKPNSNTYVSFFSGANFLAYGNTLRVTRAANNGTLNATANGAAALQIKNEDDYELNYDTGQGAFGSFAARYAGALGNSIKVGVCGSTTAFSSNVTLQASITANVANVGATTINTVGGVTSTYVKPGDFVKVGANPYIQVLTSSSSNIGLDGALELTVPAGSTILRKWEFADQFDGPPGTSEYAAGKGGSGDELHVIVIDGGGLISGTIGTVIERYPFLSKGHDAKTNDGSINYYPTVLLQKSLWIYWGDHDTNGTNWGSTVVGTTFTDVLAAQKVTLSGGTDQTVTDGDLIAGWDLYTNGDVVDISLVITGEASGTVSQYVIDNVADARKDCVAFLSPPRTAVVNNSGFESDDVVTYRNTLSSTSYAFLDGGWKYQYDKYADTYRYLPMNGDTAGLCARTDTVRDPWFSPAGYTRGGIKNVVKLSWNPAQADRDNLYKNGINPVVTFPGDGTILYGDKTLQSKPSAFDRINVRRLFIVLEKAIARASKYSLFEFNDEFTRAGFVAMVEPFLRDVQGRRGIFDFRVVCDGSNNTGEVIDSNRFIGDIYIKPARSINFIQLNFIAVRTGVSFEEVVGKF